MGGVFYFSFNLEKSIDVKILDCKFLENTGNLGGVIYNN